jgi:hypothetical protein
VIKGMVEDVQRESKGEFEWTKDVGKAVSSLTAKLYRDAAKETLHD